MDNKLDTIFSTNNPTILKGIHYTPAIVSIQKSAQKINCTEADFIQANKISFGNGIGSITNKSTAMYDVLAKFKPGSKEYEELMYRIICSVAYSQNEIDKSKGIESRPMPPEWYQYKVNVINPELDDEKTIAKKEFNMKILTDKKPYFFNLIYPERLKTEKKYISGANRKAVYQFNLTLEELFKHEKEGTLTHSQEEFLRYYYLQLPSTNNNCVMNKICWRIEEEFDGWVGKENTKQTFDHQLLKTEKPYSASVYRQVKNLYDLYVKIIERTKTEHKTYKKQTSEQGQIEILKIKENFKTEALRLCSNEEDLTNMIVDFCYGKGGSKRFAWDICGDQIIRNVLNKNDHQFSIFVQDEAGELSFKGLRFKEVKKKVAK